MPHGQGDAVAIWNLRARSLSRGTPDWAAILSPAIGWSQPDYPLLLPLTVARLWSYTGSESPAIPQFVALLFFGSSVATVGVSVVHLRGATAGPLSAMTLVAAERTYSRCRVNLPTCRSDFSSSWRHYSLSSPASPIPCC